MAIKHLGLEKKIPFCFEKKIKILCLHLLFQHFLFGFIFLAYECTFIYANHIIYIIGYLEQTGKKLQSLLYSYSHKDVPREPQRTYPWPRYGALCVRPLKNSTHKKARKWNFIKKIVKVS